jgi:hypothetical protein
MVGTRKALAMAIGNSKTDKRHTHLKERLFIAFKQKNQLIR